MAKNKLQKFQGKNKYKNIRKKVSMTRQKYQKNKSKRLTKISCKEQQKISCKYATYSKGGGSNKSLTFLLVCRNLPGKANLKKYQV